MGQADTTRVVTLTPLGRGAIATLLVAGPQAMAAVQKLFRPAAGRNAPLPLERLVLGRWAHERGEEVVVCRRAEDEIEVNCHGGQAAVAAIAESLQQLGCRPVPWHEWSREPAGDPIQIEALDALSRARTRRTAGILLDQYHGALRLQLERIRALLQAGDPSAFAEAAASIERLRSHVHLGRHLTEPFRVVLAGRPNVGKSSLINALVGYRRSIVYDQPGTTRDVVTATTAVDGWPVELADTAGLGAALDELEAAGIETARRRLAEADLVVLVFDVSQPWSAADDELLRSWQGSLVVHNKCDLPAACGSRPAGLVTSALAQQGIEPFLSALAARLVPRPPHPGTALPFHPRHFELVDRLHVLLSKGDVAACLGLLQES